ncbi:hypothetical protein SAMN04487906_2435 [Zhouia amylolytica]|uniref:Calx-beta domain-containing protein n=1 Tax=Zhouia amylolytica TaxID=376730 RepID=A0A1I6UFH7_9FLAO|nr:hypothetical protein [Zhouia amylolytica]MCQ0112424.1 hypothetical protein [Zhouia amylolytica]SFT00134.1 hypothetical protein SAMN04487906_2435 [Zhouia amylolytica]
MKNLRLIIGLLGILVVLACSDDDTIKDPIFEFISFQNESVTINENGGSIEPIPVVLKLMGYEPTEDIRVDLSVTNTNVEEGIDYELSSKSLIFKSGSFISDTLFVSTIDNEIGTDLERSFDIRIENISKPEIKVGLGIENPTNAVMKVVIADDECTETISVFDGALTNQTPWGTHDINGSVNGSVVTLVGNLITYSPFSNATLEVTLTPDLDGGTKGSATFDDFNAGTDSDGYEYQFRQVGSGSYDVCSGEIHIGFDVYYMSGGSWVYWYTTNNTITLQ